MSNDRKDNFGCPLPISDYPSILVAHGGGGKLMHQLLEKMILPTFSSDFSNNLHDSAVFEIAGTRLAITTDSYVVRPIQFPGGDIGTLAINGTINDLAMSGARPLYLSAGLILEEGLPMKTLWQILQSMKQAADIAGVKLITGDTKVVDRGKGDGIYINTSGVGIIEHSLKIEPRSVVAGDAVLVNGDLGRHGIAIMTTREGLSLEARIESDCAPLWSSVQALLSAGIDIHCLRDLTRGGLASALVEIAETANLHIEIDESHLPVREDVRGACEILGLDPVYVANEGRFVIFLPEAQVSRAIEILSRTVSGLTPVRIGSVLNGNRFSVTVKSTLGVARLLDMFSGEQLPRIC
ncbi:MAG: hydrogenase expression/formation protein HypE [bacterium]|jgi:hydrogenase expression/formation protein HypE